MNELIEKIEALPDNEYLGQYVSETNSPFCIGGNELKALVARLKEAEAVVWAVLNYDDKTAWAKGREYSYHTRMMNIPAIGENRT